VQHCSESVKMHTIFTFSLYFSFAVSGEVTCMTCFALGDVSNLMMCTNCGHHYHGSCVGLALLPGETSSTKSN
jgi:hypothetical protein